MKKIIASLLLASAMVACQSEYASNADPGSALVGNPPEVKVDSDFAIVAKSIISGPIQSRTTTQLLGALAAEEYGTLRADFAAQMFPANNLDTEENTTIDSLRLQLVFEKNGFVGDSLAPIGVEVYELSKALPYPIYSNYNPTTENAYNPSALLGSAAFTATGIGVNDTVAGADYRFAYVKMNDELMNRIYGKYKSDAQLFNNPYEFQDWFKGIYVKHTFGSGRVTRITNARMVLYYHKTYKVTDDEGVETDSISKLYTYCMAMAPEMVSSTNINYSLAQKLTQMAAAGKSVIAAPAGMDVEFQFPISQVMSSVNHAERKGITVINSLAFSIPADSIASDRGIRPPAYLLMVPTSKKDEFFGQNKLPDNITSFIGTYNSTTGQYVFSDMRGYLIEMMGKDELTADDYTFTLTPVSLVMESGASNNSYSYYYYYYGASSSAASSLMSGVTPMIARPAMVELLPAKAKIKLTFSTRSL